VQQRTPGKSYGRNQLVKKRGRTAVESNGGRIGIESELNQSCNDCANETATAQILDGSESCESVVVDVDSQRVVAGDVDVDAQVKLARVDEIRRRDVVLNDDGTPLWNLRPLADHSNSDSAGGRRLDAGHATVVFADD